MISVIVNQPHMQLFHYRISKSSQGMYVAEGRYFQSLRDLVKYHSQTAEGLVGPLRVRRGGIAQ